MNKASPQTALKRGKYYGTDVYLVAKYRSKFTIMDRRREIVRNRRSQLTQAERDMDRERNRDRQRRRREAMTREERAEEGKKKDKKS